MKKRWILLVALMYLLSACGPQIEASDPTENPTETETATSSPVPTDTPTPTNTSTVPPTVTLTPTETPIPCFTLLEPADQTEFERPMGKVTFAWTEQFGASSYRFAITIPTGNVEFIETAETSFERWLESYPLGGEYSWVIDALGEDSFNICTSGPYTFTKTFYVEQKPLNSESNGGNKDSCPANRQKPDDTCCPAGTVYDPIFDSCVNDGPG